MAGQNQESYWRIYLLLQEGCPLIFKQLVAREIEKCGGDIDALLFDNKAKLCEDLCTLDIDILFPESKKTDIDKWNTGIFPCVILTLFNKNLQQVERQLIKRIRNDQNDFEELPEMSLEYDTYDDLEQTLSKTLHKLAVVVSKEREMVTKIDELLQVFLKQPLNVVDLLCRIRTFNMPNKTRQKLRIFLEARANKENTSEIISDAQTSVKDEGSLDEYGSSRKSANVSVETQIDVNKTGKLKEASRETHGRNEKTNTTVDMIYKRTLDVHMSTKKEERSLHGYGTSRKSVNSFVEAHIDLDETGKLEEAAIVQNVEGGQTEQLAESTRLLWQATDFGENISAKLVDDTSRNKIEDWERMTVKVAVLGRSGVGKSRFINVIRSCTSKTDPLYAKVGSIETTSKAGCYPHPKNKQLEFYDLPGIGTANFTKKTFLDDERINFYSYDIYIIMSSDRFTTGETFFAEHLEKSGKMFLFVRTRVDINLDDADDENAEIELIRANCEKNLRDLSIKDTDVFLISSKQPGHKLLDFDRLVERLVYSFSGLKKDAMMFSLQFNTKKIIDDKEKALNHRIITACVASIFVDRIPVFGVSKLFDYVLVVRELDFYRTTLGVTDKNLEDLAEITNTNADELKKKYQLKSFGMYNDTRDIDINTDEQLDDSLKKQVIEYSLRTMCDIGREVPLTTTLATASILKTYLNRFVKDARKLMEIHVKEIGTNVLGVK